jgi:hypothetical protein
MYALIINYGKSIVNRLFISKFLVKRVKFCDNFISFYISLCCIKSQVKLQKYLMELLIRANSILVSYRQFNFKFKIMNLQQNHDDEVVEQEWVEWMWMKKKEEANKARQRTHSISYPFSAHKWHARNNAKDEMLYVGYMSVRIFNIYRFSRINMNNPLWKHISIKNDDSFVLLK